MTTTDTRNVEKTVEQVSAAVLAARFSNIRTQNFEHPAPQVKRCADKGADMVRITVQGKKEAEACMRIRERLFQDRYGPKRCHRTLCLFERCQTGL